MHQALYRKWRPRTFDEVYGQEHITSILKYEIANNQFSHAYLFCGSRGTGKTSCAKILAKAVNCLDPQNGNPCGKCRACIAIDQGAATDVLEMDAASNNGVDNIRDIRDEVVYSPSSLKYRVYIVDEVHMLSASAFNALLKTLEEPPAHVVFILATTELHKLPATIISRCQRFDFRRIATEVLKDHLLRVAKEENIELCESAALLLAKQAQGGMRDAISLLDLCAGSRVRIDDALVNTTVGTVGRENMLSVVKAVADKDYETLFAAIDEVVRSSRDILVFWQDLIAIYRDLLIVKTTKNAAAYLDLTDSETAALNSLASAFSSEKLSYHCGMLQEAYLAMTKANAIRRITAELTLVRMCDERLNSSPEAMLSRISSIESNLATGNFAAPTVAVSATEETAPASEPAPVAESAKPARSARRPAYVDDDDDLFRGDAPGAAPAPQRTTAQAAPAQPIPPRSTPVSHAPTSVESVRVLKPFRSRAEVIERMDAAGPMYSSFFKNAKWYTDEGGRIVLKFANQFMINNMSALGGEAVFLKAVSQVLGRPVTAKDLLCESEDEKKKDDVIEQIIEAAEE